MRYTTLSSKLHPVYLHLILDNGIENHNLENKVRIFHFKEVFITRSLIITNSPGTFKIRFDFPKLFKNNSSAAQIECIK